MLFRSVSQSRYGHADLAMCLVMFAYLTTQPAMEDLTTVSAKQRILIEQQRIAEEMMLPVGFFSDGTESVTDVLNF